MSPELRAAIAAANTEPPGPVYDWRGFFAIGPRCVTPSDVLARLIDAAKLAKADVHYAPDPVAQQRAYRTYKGRREYGRRRRQYQSHGPAAFYGALS